MSLAQRSVTSTAWNVAANLVKVGVFFVRSVLLARLLPVEAFGIYAFAGSIVTLSALVPNFGMGGAFLHRAPETSDEEQAATTHFTLKLLFTLVWAALLVAGALIFTTGQTRTALLLLTATGTGIELAQTPQLILVRRVVHSRLALFQLANALLTTVVALGLAWQGVTLWALLATDVVTLLLTICFLYLWRPVFRPRLSWFPSTMRYFLQFGSRNLPASALLMLLDRVDDLWTGIFLGETALGYYSKAYSFATYPRSILAAPINLVAGGTYAELKSDRHRLSQAFFRVNALLLRSGFLLAGLLALVAPEFIRLLLGEKWLPMLTAFRLMLVFTLLDPIKMTVASVFVAVGKPEQVVQARVIQLIILLAGLFTLGHWWGIAGVALAVDLMLLVGMTILLWQVRAYVTYSPRRMFAAPAMALILGLAAARAAMLVPAFSGSDLRTGIIKAVSYCTVYAGTLVCLERRQLLMLYRMLKRLRPMNELDL